MRTVAPNYREHADLVTSLRDEKAIVRVPVGNVTSWLLSWPDETQMAHAQYTTGPSWMGFALISRIRFSFTTERSVVATRARFTRPPSGSPSDSGARFRDARAADMIDMKQRLDTSDWNRLRLAHNADLI